MFEETRQKMEKALEVIRQDLATVRTGRATPSLLENVVIPCYGGTQKLKLQELATISVSDPQTLTISPWDASIIEEIRTGILTANLGFNPIVDGQILRINVPSLTTERRQEMVKLVKQKIEAGRIMTRQIRHEAMTEIKKKFDNNEISEDEKIRQERQLQDLTDKIISEIEVLGKYKEEELLTI